MRCRYLIYACSELPSHILKLELKPESEPLQYAAGQYLYIAANDATNLALPFSIANAPQPNGHIELHIRVRKDDANLQPLLDAIDANQPLTISKIAGNCTYATICARINRPVLLVVGGTGFAMAKSILEAAAAASDRRKFFLYWAVKSNKGFYAAQTIDLLQQKLQNLQVNIIATEPNCTHWTGHIGKIDTLLGEHWPQLIKQQPVVMAAGPFALVKSIKQFCLKHDLPEGDFFSDIAI